MLRKLLLPENSFITGTVETVPGWLSYAVSPLGLKLVKFMFPSSGDSKRVLENALGDVNIRTDPKIEKSWDSLFSDFFNGKRKDLKKVPLDKSEWSEFQKKVYRTVSIIPYGKTSSYGKIAAFLGNENASRAVGNALRYNPVPPVIPCHRIISSHKDLGGFSAAGGIKLKKILLDMEKSI